MMKPLSEFSNPKVHTVFTDIDDTLTVDGQLHANAYESLWRLRSAGLNVIPVTGRPAGWCEMIARFWPVHGVIGENGGFYFRYINQAGVRRMQRRFVFDESTMQKNRLRLDQIKNEILKKVPQAAVASDQFSRLMDLAIDFAEDVGPLPKKDIAQIVSIFENLGATAKVSSIHVNGWFGSYDKLTMTKIYCHDELGLKFDQENQRQENSVMIFCGDSPNDEPMFEAFATSFAVANLKNFLSGLKHLPTYIAQKNGGDGFSEITQKILDCRN